MNSARKNHSLTCTLVAIVFFYTFVSLLSSFFHHAHEDPTCFHDDCPACRWEQQSQENPFGSFAIVQSIVEPGDYIAGLVIYEPPYIDSQGLFDRYPSRSPPALLS